MNYTRWSKKETIELFNLVRKQLNLKDIASILNKSEIAVRKKLTREGYINKSIWVRSLDEASEL